MVSARHSQPTVALGGDATVRVRSAGWPTSVMYDDNNNNDNNNYNNKTTNNKTTLIITV